MSEFDFIKDANMSDEDKIKKAESLVSGLKDKNTELLGKQIDLKDKVQTLEAKVKETGDSDPEELKKAKTRIEELEKKIKSGKLGDDEIQDLIDAEKAKLENQYGSQIQTLTENLEKAKSQVGSVTRQNHQLQLGGLVIEATAGSGLRDKAIPIVTKMAAETWSPNDEGKFEPKSDGKIISNSEGTGPITMADWVETLRTDHDYLFSKPRGGNMDGDKAGGDKDFSKMTEAEKVKMIENNPDAAKDLPKYA